MEIAAGLRLVLGMVLVQIIATGLQVLSKVILGQGTFIFALMTYRNIVATFCVAPLAYFWERDSWKKLRFSNLIWIFLVALFGIAMAMGFFYYGLKNTSATYASNFLTLIPIVTFVISLIFRVEKLRLNTKGGMTILIGAMLSLAGALTITLYTGKTFHISVIGAKHEVLAPKVEANWTRGTIFLVCSCLSYGFWLIIQAKCFKVFPYMYCATTIICIIATFQCMIIGLSIDRTKAAWELGWNLQLLTILYSGVLATGATLCLIAWTVSKRGPTYPSMFNPLSLIMVAIVESLFLGAPLSAGSLIGMAFIIVGLYLFLWGKNREMKSQIRGSRRSEAQLAGVETPALQSTAIVVPTSSPGDNDICMDIEDKQEEVGKPK